MIDLQRSAEPMRCSLLDGWNVAVGFFLPDVVWN
jgi:hypothetical protein